MKRALPSVHGALLFAALLFTTSISAQLPAFPGAEGFGKFSVGGRYGSVYHVTNLNNSGPGSLRDALGTPNRIVVFDVAGVIRISERMIVSPNLYIAGQTAPGEGITVYGNGWSFSNASNTICRYVKIRMGIVGSSGVDANGLASGHDIIFDHCSVSWGRDENFSINSTTAQNITIQNSIISQGLLTHSAGGLIQCDGGITLYRNLYADNGTRNNKVKGVSQYVNNIVYNWSAGAYIMGGESSGNSYVNVTNNCFIQGPVDGVRPLSAGNSLFHIYAQDNIYDNNRNGLFDPSTVPESEYEGPPDFQAAPYAYPALPTMPAQSLISTLLPTVGASLPYRDYADYYVINEVKSFGKRGELIANEGSLPFGAPTSWNLWAGTSRMDTDNDGMPDAWETANGTNPAVNDAMLIATSGYTNIENYINSIGAANSQEYLRAPMKLKTDSATQNTLYLSWLDYTEKEAGYVVERMVNGSWAPIGSTGTNVNFFAVTGMQPEEADTFRVKAHNSTMESGYSNELIATTKPVEVPVLEPATFTPDLTWSGALSNDWDRATQNWINNGNAAALFSDSSKLLFPDAGTTGRSINITAAMGAHDILVNSSGNYTFSGAGTISGSGSLNKDGSGKLTLPTSHTYTGATVLRSGTFEFSKLANGGVASSIGASANYNFNWVWKGGKWEYTGGSSSTDRNAVIDATTEFSVANSASTVTFNGVLSGDGGLVKSGPGRLVLRSANPYAGETIIRGGTLEISPLSSATLAEDIIDNGVAIGTSNVLRLHNGTFTTSNGSSTIYENYPMQLYVEDGTVNGFEPYRNANLGMTVHGGGTLNYAIPYLRELVQGDWSDFTGTLVANGVNAAEGSILMIDNGTGFPNNRVVATGNTKIASFQNNNTIYFGGLSGLAGTMLSCGGTKSPTFGNGFTTYVVGAAGTDETFSGVINNHLYGNSADGNGSTTIVKEGSGLWRLTGNNTYIGTTTVTGGKLIVNGSNSGPGKVTVNDGATLAGKGTISGEVEVSGVLEPGDSSIATLTLKDKLVLNATAVTAIEINKAAGASDKISVTSNIAYGGTLQIHFTGTAASGDVFRIFSTTAAVSGTIIRFDPATPGPGLLWKFKPATGELAVQAPNFVEAPSGLQLNATTSNLSATSSVTAIWNDNSDNEDYFILERSTDSVTFTDIAHIAADSINYKDNGLVPGTKYFYRIKAHSTLSESAYSAIASATPLPLGTLPTIAVNPYPAQAATNVFLDGNAISLAWSSNYADSFSVYLGSSATAMTRIADIATATTGFTATALNPNTQYFWRIDAKNGSGTTTGTVWNFRTANIPTVAAGDYRSAASGNWGTSTVATNIWEVFDGSNWNATGTLPTSTTRTVTIRTGNTVRLNATTTANNLVIESGATLVSGTSDGAVGTATQRTLRVISSINNFGTVGSSTTSANRINFEGYRDNGTIFLTGSSTFYLNTFTVNSIAVSTDVVIDADLNLSGFMRANFATTTTLPWTGAPQNDDQVSITINEGKTVTMGSSGFLQNGSSPTTNTIGEFGTYTFNINGTLDMRATGTSCVVGHASLPRVTTINVNGTWLMGNAIRFIPSGTAAPTGSLALNIGTGGVVDAGARTIGTGNAATNIVVANTAFNGTAFFNISGSGLLKSKVSTTDVLFPIGSGGIYSPVKISNAGTADIVGAGVGTGITQPVDDPARAVNKQYSIVPATPASVNLAISLGWLAASQGAGFTPSVNLVQGHYQNGDWTETTATLSGAGTLINPYYARTTGNNSFGTFAVANTFALNDDVAPVVAQPQDIIVGNSAGQCSATINFSAQASDNVAVSSLKYYVHYGTTNEQEISFPATLPVGNHEVTVVAKDAAGNLATKTFSITVNDNTAPAAHCKPVELYLELNGTATLTAAQVDDGSSDNCGGVTLGISRDRFTTADLGTNTVTLTVTDASGNSSQCTATVTIKKRPVIVTYSGDRSAQYSDRTLLTAVLRDSISGTAITGKDIRFDIGTQGLASTTNGSGLATGGLLLTQDPATAYTVRAAFAGDDIFEAAAHLVPFDILPEDARTYYSGTLLASTGSGSAATITLSATIRDITAETGDAASDAFAGDIRNARVSFIDRSTNTVIATVPVGLVNGTDNSVGTATYNWNVDIGNTDAKDYTIGIVVSGYYTRNSSGENTVLTVSKSTGDHVTGAGYIVLERSSGLKKADAASRNNFGFDVRYNRSRTQLQGHFNTILRRAEADGLHVYQIKANAMTSLSATPATTTAPGRATFNGKASIQDITDPFAPIAVDGNANILVAMSDSGEPGTNDAIAITVWNKTGGLWYASNWDGIRTQEQVLAGGNIRISSVPDKAITRIHVSGATSATELPAAGLELAASPNPAAHSFGLTIRSGNTRDKVTVQVLDISGRPVELLETTASGGTIHLGAHYRPGTYLVEVRQGRESKVLQLVKLKE
jgi:autotransporter-associated beta strand protein